MAMIHMIYLAHMGSSDGRDPASLWKFVKMLGRTEITAKCPNLNAAHDLLSQASEAFVLAALVEMVADRLQLKFVDGLW
jgi:hypothetical protein